MAEAKKETKAKQVKKAEVIAEVAPAGNLPEAKMEITETAAEPKATAKAGKRSAKALKEADEQRAKEERKASGVASAKKPAAQAKPRSRIERAGKKYRELAKQIDPGKSYTPQEGLELIVKTSPTKFDGTVELHVNLGIDPTQSDQNVRSTASLPSGTGKNVRVAVLTEDDKHKILPKLDKEQIDFDVLITTPAMMPQLGKYARLLGPRGLMPNPKSGTVTTDLDKAAKEAQAGKVEFRSDQAGIVHAGIGKASFGPDKLLANLNAILDALKAAKPASLKGVYIKSAYLSTTMGPSLKIEV